MLVSLVCNFRQQLFQSVPAPRHRHVVLSKARSRAEVVPSIPHVKDPLVLRTCVTVLRQVELENLLLAQVDGALLAVVRVVVLHLQAAPLVDASRVGEDVIDGGAQLHRLQDPLNEHGVGVGDDDAIHHTFVFLNKGEQVCHPSREGDGLHHAPDPVRTDLLLPYTSEETRKAA